jgi:hypothetical protein
MIISSEPELYYPEPRGYIVSSLKILKSFISYVSFDVISRIAFSNFA